MQSNNTFSLGRSFCCKLCVFPSTKPHIQFNDKGICTGCLAYINRKEINWNDRKIKFSEILKKYKEKTKNYYHCIIPSSGGKDSHYQTIKALEFGLNPLVVSVVPDKLSELGQHNKNNLKKLGVDTMEISLNPTIRHKINKFGLETVGDICWPEHITIFTIPKKISVSMKISLLIYGENPENENGGPIEDQNKIILDRRWMEEYGGLLGLRTNDIEHILKIPKEKLILYTYPTKEELIEAGTTALFLGQFFPWDGHTNAKVAKEHGFKTYFKDVEGSIVDYENLDNVYFRVHDYFKFLKYGYDRVTDWSSWHIRRGRMTREEAVRLNQERSGKFPEEYLGYSLSEILDEIDCSRDEFIKICDKFTNKSLFLLDKNNNLIKDKSGNLTLRNREYK
jgi:N-acetyl sugar amidotransferase